MLTQKPDIMMVSHTAISEAVIPLINENKIPTFLLAVSMSNITNQRDWVFKIAYWFRR